MQVHVWELLTLRGLCFGGGGPGKKDPTHYVHAQVYACVYMHMLLGRPD